MRYFPTVVTVVLSAFGLATGSSRADVPAAWRDDADLTSVALVDEHLAWACGDRGVVLHSADGGTTWQAQRSGVDCRLYCVQFLDERNGWIVGGGYEPYVHRSRGVVLRTVDGGATWQPEPAALVPLLRKIQMTNPREGWAAGDASELSPAGIYFTRDGEKTWSGAGGRLPAGVVTADLSVSPDGAASVGLCADGRGRLFRIENRMPTSTPLAAFDLRTVSDLRLADAGASWLVGDGGLVRRSDDAGRSWHVAGTDFSEGVGAQCDWRALAVYGSHLWIVGAPGSVVLHSADFGATWQLLPTGQTTPLADVAFVNDRRGAAVGALGTILTTDDGGASWRSTSGMPRRAALWACFADAASLPAEFIAQGAAEDGYRTAVTLLGRRDAEPGVDDRPPTGDRHIAAAVALGAASAEQEWAFPLRQSPLEPAAETVLQAWGDGDVRAGAAFAKARLVRTLRMWRPEVVLTHASAPRGDAPTTHLLHQLVLEAVEAAGDPAQFPEQLDVLGLAACSPRKVFGYDAAQRNGTATLDRKQVMTRTAQTLDDFCEPYRGLVYDRRGLESGAVACRLAWNRTAAAAAPRELFAGIELPIGGECRRVLETENAESRVRMRRAAERQRNLESLVLQRSGTAGAGLVDQIRAATAGQDDDAAGDTVFYLAESFRAHGRWEAARETYEYLIARYPQHSTTSAALRRTIHYLSSGEADRRLRRTLDDLGPRSEQSVTALEPAAEPAVQRPKSVAGAHEPTGATLAQRAGDAQPQTATFETLKISTAPFAPTITTAPYVATPAARLLGKGAESNNPAPAGDEAGATSAATPATDPVLAGATDPADRRRRALGMGAYLQQRDPAGAAQPAIDFALAAARRRLGQSAEAEAAYERFVGRQADDAWTDAAIDELALARQKPTQRRTCAAAQTAERPLLDGVLDDTAWRTAEPIELRSALGDDAAWPATVWIAADGEYLYYAVRCRRTEPAPPLGTQVRQRDADLKPYDRVELLLDVDRDYATYYRLAIDCRGWTGETCWDDATWDPRWFVAAGGDAEFWTAEAAVPWRELADARPSAGDVWALGVQRVAPRTGFQSWTTPAAAMVRPEGFGYLTFP